MITTFICFDHLWACCVNKKVKIVSRWIFFFDGSNRVLSYRGYTAWTVNVVLLSIVHVDNAAFPQFFSSC